MIANIGYDFLNDVCAIENILMDFSACSLLDTDTLIVIFVGICTVLFELSTLFPCKSIAQIALRVTVGIIISYKLLFVKKNSAPGADSEESTLETEKICCQNKNLKQ